MIEREPARDPGIWDVLAFVTPLIWRAKWLIIGATIVAAAVGFAVDRAGSVRIWSGKTTLTVGLVPNLNYLLSPNTSRPLEPIESTRMTVMRMSDARFRAEVVNTAAFEPATATLSRSLVSSSLRGVVLEDDRDVAVELSAASPADVEAALHALAAQIAKAHSEILDQRMQLLQRRIDDDTSRMADLKKSSDLLLDRIFKDTDDKGKGLPSVVAAIPAWNDLHDAIQRDTNLKLLIEPTVLHLEPGTYLQGPRNVSALRNSLLAGLGMLFAMIVLTVVINVRARPPSFPS